MILGRRDLISSSNGTTLRLGKLLMIFSRVARARRPSGRQASTTQKSFIAEEREQPHSLESRGGIKAILQIMPTLTLFSPVMGMHTVKAMIGPTGEVEFLAGVELVSF